MHNDTTTWKAVAFLQKCEIDLPDFQYKVHFGFDGLPDAIMFMTAAMRKNLIRFGHMMFLDAQMRAFNQLCWPYIGIVLINNLNRICLCCEAIVIGETLEIYVWLLRMLDVMVQEWNLLDLKIVFEIVS